ncbi:glycosyltransferase family 2 protein [uncultured Tateyamaria sp.]|uniref:glycosyltransferase family 2 protein n=1 Tax=Tateyamaria sp. 1078 TaxID=3417464 RepID=UPI002609463C|nr:glycosyltransferase family 2 protein [uncultured Tateyamaria sp.]
MARWGISTTILAPVDDILRFAAYHLELGAHRLYLYLDDDNAEAFKALKAHPKIRVQTCDTAHWKRLIGKHPARHQVRQTLNATHAYNRRTEVDWLIHMDVDEFLVPAHPLPDMLDRLPPDTRAARARPMEMLGGSHDAFKAFIPAGPDRHRIVAALYPNFGRYLKAGFVSHAAGKVFVRTGQPDISVQIHDALHNDVRLPATELVQVDLAHCHAASWEAWRAAFAYRLQKGSYRPEIKAALPPEDGGLSIHDMLSTIQAQDGDAGLRAFYDEVIGDSPDLRARLHAQGLLRLHDLSLGEHMRTHFPDMAI